MLNSLAIRLQNGQVSNAKEFMLTCTSPGIEVNPEFLTMAEHVLRALEGGDPDTEEKQYQGVLASYAPDCVTNGRQINHSIKKYQTKKEDHDVVMAGIDKSLCSGRIVGANLCGFMMAPSATQFDQLKVQRGTEDANISGDCPPQIGATKETPNFKHVVSIVKFRGEGANKQYLVQNSWGRTCNFPLTRDGSGLMTCERNENNGLTGRFWVDSDLILNNTIALNILQGR
jgi:hypothetical protein